MKAIVCLSWFGIGLALGGCKGAGPSQAEDAGPPDNHDATMSPADRLPDVLAPSPDLATAADLPAGLVPDLAALVPEDTAPAPDLAALPDAVPDLAASAAKEDMAAGRDSASTDTPRDASPSVDLGSFCTGGASKLTVNGISSNPTVTGKVIPSDCCESAEFQISSPSFEHPIAVAWRAEAAAFTGFKTIDLANPPTGWSVRLAVGCSSAVSCTSEVDGYTGGLSGSLSVGIGKRTMFDMSVCLHVEEPAGSPHAVVHTLDLFATHIEAD